MHGARGEVEGVRVPLEDELAAVEMAEQPVGGGRRLRLERIPADLAHGVRQHRRAERCGEKLRAEADAEDGDIEL